MIIVHITVVLQLLENRDKHRKSIVEDRNGGAQCKMRKMLLMWMHTGSKVRNAVCWPSFIQSIDVVFLNVVFC